LAPRLIEKAPAIGQRSVRTVSDRGRMAINLPKTKRARRSSAPVEVF
jgi:hypothetical protein